MPSRAAMRYNARKNGTRPIVTPAQKKCSKCGTLKLASEFRTSYHNDTGLDARCNSCVSVDNRQKLYGVTGEEYVAKMVEQGCVCAICGRPETTLSNTGSKLKDLAQDHNHETGRNRGLLCSNCNKGLGNFGDDPDRLLAAAAYLLAHSDVLGRL